MADPGGELGTDYFYFDNEQLSVDSEDGFQYENVSVDEELIISDICEDLEDAVRNLKEEDEDAEATIGRESPEKASVITKPEIIDDFVRNFLVRMKMTRTLDMFQTEWYEMQQKGLVNVECVGIVPDLYTKHQLLEEDLLVLRKELFKFKTAALKTKDVYVRLRKERDYHKMHHQRVMQEKHKLISDIKRLKDHCAAFEPALEQLKVKYEAAMKEKMMTQLERDRVVGQINALQHTLKSSETLNEQHKVTSRLCNVGGVVLDKDGRGPTQRTLMAHRGPVKDVATHHTESVQHPKDSLFPPDRGINPILSETKKVMAKITKAGGYNLTSTFIAHEYPLSSIAVHPRKDIIATTGDDRKWKLWSVPLEEIILSGEGHTDWLSSCCFHPKGTGLATSSGDATVKIWSFNKAECVHTFSDHMGPVWDCDWHYSGDFLVSSAQDNTARVWDLNSLRCRSILRGHTDCVNSVIFLPYCNSVLTSSVDKTISLWDSRTAICAQTFYGHVNSINNATVNSQGDTVVSGDSYGIIKLWDMRRVAPITSFDVGPHPANHVTFDPSGSVVLIASNDSTIKMYHIATAQVHTMVGHTDAVTCVKVDKMAEYIVSVGNDCNVCIWS